MGDASVESYLRSRSDYPMSTCQTDENWKTKKRTETVTTKSQERQIQRQVVLEDGRVIQEDVPEVTVDTTEDRQSHVESDIEDRDIANDDWVPVIANGNDNGSNVVGDRNFRNTRTRDVLQESSTTAAAQNIGELTATDVDKVIQYGRDVRGLARRFEEHDRAVAIPAKMTHKNKTHKRTVDREDIREVDVMHNGSTRTDRYVKREVIEDDLGQTPEEGSSTDGDESYDGDGDQYHNRKEERFIDYYSVPRGRPLSEGKLVRKGIHLKSQDKDSRKKEPAGWMRNGGGGASRKAALTYSPHHQRSDELSDSTSADAAARPPPRGGRSGGNRRYSSSDQEKRMRRLPSSERSFPLQSGGGVANAINKRYHTVDRNQRLSREQQQQQKQSHPRARVASTTIGSYTQYPPPSSSSSPRRSSRREATAAPAPTYGHSDNSDRSYRSRSMSRSSGDRLHGRTAMRSDLDSERESRLRRAMSFNSGKSSDRGRKKEGRKESFIDSMKSLYATISKRATSPSKAGSSTGGSRRSRVTNEWFDSSPTRGGAGGGGRRQTAPPSAPPRRGRSSLNLNGGSSVYSDDNRTSPWTTPAGSMKRTSTLVSSGRSQSRPSNTVTRSTVNLRYGGNGGESNEEERKRSRSGGNSRIERRKTISSYDDVPDNRNLPRFESASGGGSSRRSVAVMHGGGGGNNRESMSIRSDASSRGGRVFGQSEDGGADSDVGGSTRRPAPDMRRLLLNNVNTARKKSGGGGGGGGKDSDSGSGGSGGGGGRHVIRAI